MREIKFRGKRISDGIWIYGGFHKHQKITQCPFVPNGEELKEPEYAYLIIISGLSDWNIPQPLQAYEVDPATVGQFTGLGDKNGTDVYEGDILQFDDIGGEGFEYEEGYDFVNVASVVYQNGRFELDNFGDTNSGIVDDMNNCHGDFTLVFGVAKVIGNIYQNPELLIKE